MFFFCRKMDLDVVECCFPTLKGTFLRRYASMDVLYVKIRPWRRLVSEPPKEPPNGLVNKWCAVMHALRRNHRQHNHLRKFWIRWVKRWVHGWAGSDFAIFHAYPCAAVFITLSHYRASVWSTPKSHASHGLTAVAELGLFVVQAKTVNIDFVQPQCNR